MTLPGQLTLACLACVAALLIVDHLGWPWARVLAKLGASTCFVGLAAALGAAQSAYGQLILLALILGWLGDALLLSEHPAAFIGGLAAFLCSHLAYAGAFAGALAPADSTPWPVLGLAALAAAAVGWAVLRWLMPHVPSDMRIPVRVYVLVILAMCVTALGHSSLTGHWIVATGALLFAASDISVARDKFVRPGYLNRLWGWPAYFVAQLILAWSVVAGG